MFHTLGIIVFFVILRAILGIQGETELYNLMPFIGISFVGSLYMPNKNLWILPAIILLISNFFINFYFGLPIVSLWSVLAIALLASYAFLGKVLKERKSFRTLMGGTLLSTFSFYFISNTFAFFASPIYTKNYAGWVQALTVGVPGYPPTFLFLRNSLIADLGFALFTYAYFHIRSQKTNTIEIA